MTLNRDVYKYGEGSDQCVDVAVDLLKLEQGPKNFNAREKNIKKRD